MKGLKYVGTHEEGIRVMLFKSYKTVLLRKYCPYTFTENDDTSKEAENYYRKLRKLGVETTDNPEDLVVGKKRLSAPAKRVQTLEAEEVALADKLELASDEEEVTNEEVQVEDAPTSGTEEVTGDTTSEVDEVADIVTTAELTPDMLKEMSDDELAEYLDMNLERDQIKDIIEACEMDISVGRKGKSALISEILESYKDKLLEYLAK